MSDGMRRELAYLSSHATNRYFIPNWGSYYNSARIGQFRYREITQSLTGASLHTKKAMERVITSAFHRHFSFFYLLSNCSCWRACAQARQE